MADSTTIEVKTTTWRRLNRLKSPGQSFDEVVSDLLNSTDERHERHETQNDD